MYNKKKNRNAISLSKAQIKKLEECAACSYTDDSYQLHPFMGEDLKSDIRVASQNRDMNRKNGKSKGKGALNSDSEEDEEDGNGKKKKKKSKKNKEIAPGGS